MKTTNMRVNMVGTQGLTLADYVNVVVVET